MTWIALHLLWLAAALPVVWTAGSICLAGERVQPKSIVILSTPHPTYQEAAAAAETALAASGYKVTRIWLPKGAHAWRHDRPAETGAGSPPHPQTVPSPPGLPPGEQNQPPPELQEPLRQIDAAAPSVILSVGEDATETALEARPGTPVVFCMIPNALDMPFLQPGYPGHDRVAGVAADIDPVKQMDWILAICPKTRRLCVPGSPRSVRTTGAIEAAGNARGVEVRALDVRREQFGSALKYFDDNNCEGVIMVPNADVYSAATVKELLLWGLRNRKAVWTFAPTIVEAGALGGQYIEASTAGRQAADIARRIAAGTRPSDIGLQYPDVVRTAVNKRTAEMLGISLGQNILDNVTVRYPESP